MKRKIVAALVSIILFLAVFFSVMFVSSEINHKCIGDGCPICHEIEVCVQTLHSIGAAVIAAVSVFLSSLLSAHVQKAEDQHSSIHTLVALKVKLSD